MKYIYIPCQKLYQAEKVRSNKQMSPTKIENIIGTQLASVPFPYKNREHNRAPNKLVSPTRIEIILLPFYQLL